MKKGFSLIEVILAAALFVLFTSGVVRGVIGALDANRQANELVVAKSYAEEGIEAMRSLRNMSFSNLQNTSPTTGITRSGSIWAYSGVNNIFDSRFTRTIAVSNVERNGAGDIVASGGTVDPRTKKIVVNVAWNFTAVKPRQVTLIDYLTDWRAVVGQGVLVYGDTTGVAQPKTRIYDNGLNTFGAEDTTGSGFVDAVVGKSFQIETSPTKREAISGYVNNNGVLRIMCFDGRDWTSEFTTTVGGTGTNDQRFGIAYETNSGDVLVVYGTNAGTNEMAYRTKAGSSGCGAANWSGATNIEAVRTTGIVHWIRMEANPLAASNNIGVAWADANSDLSAMQWTGSSWGIAEPSAALETNLERVTASQDVQSFDLAYETQTGNLMVVWGLSQATTCTAGVAIAATNCIRFSQYTSSWSAVAVIPTVADPATNIDISASPNSNELVVAAVDNSQADLSIAYWSGSVWTGSANVDTTAQAVTAGSMRVSTGWLVNGATRRYIVVYNDAAATNLGWYVGNAAGVPAAQADFATTPALANPQSWYSIRMDPLNTDRLMFLVSDNSSDLFAKRLVMTAVPGFTWTNADGGAVIENSLGQATTRPFSFRYWRNP